MRQVIHIADEKIDVIEHLKKQNNMSGYVVTLIKKDMENQLITRDEIINLIKKHGGNTESIGNSDLMDSMKGCLDF